MDIAIIVIAMTAGAWSILFQIIEINWIWNAISKTAHSPGFFAKIRGIFNVIGEIIRFLLDFAITVGMATAFSLTGNRAGMIVSLMASGAISTYLYFKRKPKCALK